MNSNKRKILKLNRFIDEVGLAGYSAMLRATKIVFDKENRRLPIHINKSLENYAIYKGKTLEELWAIEDNERSKK
tara:strand:+ start:250 stop:474 length:225 start_codon:yes stop_codon:yes gene_type:complete